MAERFDPRDWFYLDPEDRELIRRLLREEQIRRGIDSEVTMHCTRLGNVLSDFDR